MSGPVSWEDFCCMVAPSHCTISNSPGRERPGIWRDRPRLAHKSQPWGPRQNSDIITTRPSVLWSGWLCSSLTVLFQLIWVGSTLWYNPFLPKLPGLFSICITLVNVPFQSLNLYVLTTKRQRVYFPFPCRNEPDTYLGLRLKHKILNMLVCDW